MSLPALSFPLNTRPEETRGKQYRKTFRFWYDAIIDILLLEPQVTQQEIAKRLGRGAQTISLICSSDLFRARYDQRRTAMSSAMQNAINGKLSAVALSALDLQAETLELKRTTIPLPDLVDIADKALSRLGYGPKATASPQVVIQQNNAINVPVSRSELEASRERLLAAERAKLVEYSDHEPQPAVVSEPGAEETKEESL